MPAVLDIEQAIALLELEAPFEKRDVQIARRRMAKRWHPDIAPPGKQFEHERHLKAINQAADQLESLAEGSRGGRVSRNAVKVSAAAARRARAEAGRRAYEAEQRRREAEADRQKHDPFGSRVPDHSVVHRYARCVSYPEWGVGTVSGIYFTGDGDDDVQQWARVKFAPGVRTVPAGSLQFVDFSKPDPGADRVQRFMTAAQHAMAEGDYKLAAQRLIYARDAEPDEHVGPAPHDARVLAGGGPDRRRAAPCATGPASTRDRPAAHRFAARIYEDMGAIDLAAEAADRAADRAPEDADAWERVGRLRLRLMDRAAAITALERARTPRPERRGAARPRARLPPRRRPRRRGHRHRAGHPPRPEVPGRLGAPRPRARPHRPRVGDAIGAAERALSLNGHDAEVADLLARLRGAEPRVLPAA